MPRPRVRTAVSEMPDPGVAEKLFTFTPKTVLAALFTRAGLGRGGDEGVGV